VSTASMNRLTIIRIFPVCVDFGRNDLWDFLRRLDIRIGTIGDDRTGLSEVLDDTHLTRFLGDNLTGEGFAFAFGADLAFGAALTGW